MLQYQVKSGNVGPGVDMRKWDRAAHGARTPKKMLKDDIPKKDGWRADPAPRLCLMEMPGSYKESRVLLVCHTVQPSCSVYCMSPCNNAAQSTFR